MIDSATNLLLTAKAIKAELHEELRPPEEGRAAGSDAVVLMSLVRGTRGYIEKVANQVNGSYEHGLYDACAVMIRRLLETLIIEAFEAHQIEAKIKTSNGDYFYLRDMIDAALRETSWTIGRNSKTAMPRLKDVGDKSAHSRRFVAQRGDIDKLVGDIRVVVQELIYLAKLK